MKAIAIIAIAILATSCTSSIDFWNSEENTVLPEPVAPEPEAAPETVDELPQWTPPFLFPEA